MAEEKAFLVPVVIDGTFERDASVPDKFRDVLWSRLSGLSLARPMHRKDFPNAH